MPQVSIIAGPCAGGAAYSPALTDFIIMVDGTATMFIAGPEVIKAATGEEISEQNLGGAAVHGAISGNIHFVAKTDAEAIALAQALLSYLPSNNLEAPPDVHFDEPIIDDPAIDDVVPDDPRKAYDVREVIVRLADAASFLEIQREFASNLVIGFARMAGIVVGIVANQPQVLAGSLDINASYTSVIDWPVNYGGKPFNSFPSFIVITIVLTILTVTITSLFTFSVRSKLFPGQVPVIFDERATDDKFIIVLDSGMLGEETAGEAGRIMSEAGATEILEKEINGTK